MIRVELVRTEKDWDDFFQLGLELNKPEESSSQSYPPFWLRKVLNLNKNPFFEKGLMRPLLAKEGNVVKGRLVGFLDQRSMAKDLENSAWFGFFESQPEAEVAEKLFADLNDWLKTWGIKKLKGPIEYRSFMDFGWEMENPYFNQITPLKFNRLQTSFDYEISTLIPLPDQIQGEAHKLRENNSVHILPLKPSEVAPLLPRFFESMDELLKGQSLTHSPSVSEWNYIFKLYETLFVESYAWVIEVNHQPAMLCVLVDSPPQFPKNKADELKTRMLPKNKKGSTAQLLVFTEKKEYQSFEVFPLLLDTLQKQLPALGTQAIQVRGIANYHTLWIKILEMLGAKKIRTTHLVEKIL